MRNIEASKKCLKMIKAAYWTRYPYLIWFLHYMTKTLASKLNSKNKQASNKISNKYTPWKFYTRIIKENSNWFYWWAIRTIYRLTRDKQDEHWYANKFCIQIFTDFMRDRTYVTVHRILCTFISTNKFCMQA